MGSFNAPGRHISAGKGAAEAKQPLNAYAARQAQWMARLAKAPLVNLSGVVGPGGASGGRSQGERQWTLLLTFDA